MPATPTVEDGWWRRWLCEIDSAGKFWVFGGAVARCDVQYTGLVMVPDANSPTGKSAVSVSQPSHTAQLRIEMSIANQLQLDNLREGVAACNTITLACGLHGRTEIFQGYLVSATVEQRADQQTFCRMELDGRFTRLLSPAERTAFSECVKAFQAAGHAATPRAAPASAPKAPKPVTESTVEIVNPVPRGPRRSMDLD